MSSSREWGFSPLAIIPIPLIATPIEERLPAFFGQVFYGSAVVIWRTPWSEFVRRVGVFAETGRDNRYSDFINKLFIYEGAENDVGIFVSLFAD
jgi:hypothetical protein